MGPWILGCLAIVFLLFNGRRQRRRFGFPVRPMWAEVLLGVVGCPAVIGIAAFANANLWPQGSRTAWPPSRTGVRRPRAACRSRRVSLPDRPSDRRDPGDDLAATRRRFGRYVYAYGGNPDAAELAGINTRWTILKTYVADGHPVRARRRRRRGAAQRLHARRRHRTTSSTSSPRPSSAAPRSQGASGLSQVPFSAPSSCSRSPTVSSFIGVNSPGQNVAAGDRPRSSAVGFDTFNRRRGS